MPFVTAEAYEKKPTRIISAVPSLTELLYALQLDDEVRGITKFCVRPNKWFRNRVRVGGTKNLDLDLIRALNPDLLIANKEENEREQIEALAEHFPVYLSQVESVEDAIRTILEIGKLTDRNLPAKELTEGIIRNLDRPQQNEGTPCRVLYLIWRKPWMGAGRQTFIHNLLEHNGWHNVLGDGTAPRYPSLTEEQISQLRPDVIMLSSEPYPFAEKHLPELRKMVPNAKIILVDGEFFSWYGPRLLFSMAHFSALRERIRYF